MGGWHNLSPRLGPPPRPQPAPQKISNCTEKQTQNRQLPEEG